MEKYDWKSNIKMNIKMLRYLGLWPKGDGSYTAGPYMIYTIFLVSVFVSGFILVQVAEVYFIRTDLEALTGIFFVLLLEFMILFKICYMIANIQRIKDLLEILNTDMFQPKNDVQIKAIDANMWLWNFLYKTFLYSIFCMNLFFAIYPFWDKSEGNGRRLPFLSWYPFDVAVSPYYEIAYVHQICGAIVASFTHANIDALLAALNTFNGSQFDILGDNLRNLHRLSGNVATNFVNCVKHHKEILRFSQKCNTFLNWILLVQFFVSAVSIGITLFQLTVLRPMSNQFFSVLTYLTAILVEIFMYCWFGNEVELKSRTISYAVFECDWTDFPDDLKRGLLIFTIRVQIPVKLSTLNLFYLSLDTFKKIMKTSWSYFALLHQVTSK